MSNIPFFVFCFVCLFVYSFTNFIMITCVFCEESIPCITQIKLHLKFRHSDYTGKFNCKETRCFRSFGSWAPYRRHLLNVHKADVLKNVVFSQTAPCEAEFPISNIVSYDNIVAEQLPASSNSDFQPSVSLSECDQAI